MEKKTSSDNTYSVFSLDAVKNLGSKMQITEIKKNSFPKQNINPMKNNVLLFRLKDCTHYIHAILKDIVHQFLYKSCLIFDPSLVLLSTPAKLRDTNLNYTELCIQVSNIPLCIPDDLDIDLSELHFYINIYNKSNTETILLMSDDIMLKNEEKKYEQYKDIIIPKGIVLYRMLHNTAIVINEIRIHTIRMGDTDKINKTLVNADTTTYYYTSCFNKAIYGNSYTCLYNKTKEFSEINPANDKEHFDQTVTLTTFGPYQPKQMLLESIKYFKDYMNSMEISAKEQKIKYDYDKYNLIQCNVIEYFVKNMFISFMRDDYNTLVLFSEENPNEFRICTDANIEKIKPDALKNIIINNLILPLEKEVNSKLTYFKENLFDASNNKLQKDHFKQYKVHSKLDF